MQSSPLVDLLSDIREHTGAANAAIWDTTNSAITPTLLHYSSTDECAPVLDAKCLGLVTWASQQAVGEMCTDGDVVRVAATPIVAEDDTHLVLAVASNDGPLAMQRDQLRHWLPRMAARAATLQGLLEAQAAAAQAERHADLLLLTATQLQEHRTVEELGASLCSAAGHMTGARRVALVRWHAVARMGEVAYATRGHMVSAGWPVSSSSETGAACIGDSQVLIENGADRVGGFIVYGGEEPKRPLGSLMVVPLRGADGVIGALVMEGDTATHVSQTDAKHLRLLGMLGAAALETVWEIEEINRRARTDALTGLANRQQFEERLTRIVAETNRFGGSCVLVVIDIDRFKHVNDTFGHQVGDQVLKRVAAVLEKEVRTVDLCARYGGEEMAILLPQTDLSGGSQLAERLRRAVCDNPFVIGGHDINITISLGVAAYPDGAADRDELFAAADRALYSAKRAGRNKVMTGAA